MDDTTAAFYWTVAFIILLIGFSKGGSGGTFGVLETFLIALVVYANTVIGLLLRN